MVVETGLGTCSGQPRFLFMDGYSEAVVALCGMTVEALCISVAEDRVPEGMLKNKLLDSKERVETGARERNPHHRTPRW